MTTTGYYYALLARDMTNKEILAQMDELYEQLQSATDTTTRKKSYEAMVGIYEKHPFLSKYWEIRQNVRKYVDRIIRKVVEIAEHIAETIAPSIRINWNGIQPMDDGIQQFYLIRLLDADGQLVYSKVGTTSRKTTKRMTEHLRAYAKDGVRYLDVKRLYDCGGMEAEMYESAFRAKYMRVYKGAFRKNDRFINTEFDYEEADRLFEELRQEV